MRVRPGRVIVGIVLVLAVTAAGVVALLNTEWASRRVAHEAAAMLEARFAGRVRVESLSMSLFPRVSISGTNLQMTRDDGQAPMLEVARFAVSGTPLELLRRGASHVELDGLQLYITKGGSQAAALRGRVRDVHIGEVHVTSGRLVIVPDDVRKIPLEFGLQDLTLTNFGFDRATVFAARLVNPKPRALIQTEGRFGPWQAGLPRSTPVSGVYLFHDGELDAIKGLGGHLTSSGKFAGALERLAVEGTTTSSDFQLDLADQPMPLRTAFKATVDGTRGDTFLDDVDATLGNSRIRAHGSVASTPGAKGRTVTLSVTMKDARFEDLLRLSVKASEPPMRGRLDIDTGFDLPPGDQDVAQRLRLRGRFAIRGGHFASDTAQNKIDELSRRGRGEPGNEEVSNVISAFGGAFTLQDGVLRLPGLQFSVKGARVDLDGRYTLRSQGLDFTGALRLDAPVSRTVTGFKSILLRPIDPLFRRNGAGTLLPIRISGTVNQPDFGVDMKKALRRE
ncbi:MAG TPA: AsmA-like C-terminal region-containing protein [Vicinamibacterales bacterium]|nr:AsmA-like C-terminal region-containing protein [Vicinamibacterales bacterium]